MSQTNPIIEDGIIAGNLYDKYGTANPISQFLLKNFINSVDRLISSISISEIHEVGCGEGHLTRELANRHPVVRIRASDFSSRVIEVARTHTQQAGGNIPFKVASIYDLQPEEDAAELIVCCEVLEHLELPEQALKVLAQLAKPYLVVSVPREPIWRALNLVRGKYISDLGNTPGHLQHWSSTGFVRLLRQHVEVIKVLHPLPWAIALCRIKSS